MFKFSFKKSKNVAKICEIVIKTKLLFCYEKLRLIKYSIELCEKEISTARGYIRVGEFCSTCAHINACDEKCF